MWKFIVFSQYVQIDLTASKPYFMFSLKNLNVICIQYKFKNKYNVKLKLHLRCKLLVTFRVINFLLFICAGVRVLNLAWNPGFPSIFAVCLSSGSVLTMELTETEVKTMATLPANIKASASKKMAPKIY